MTDSKPVSHTTGCAMPETDDPLARLEAAMAMTRKITAKADVLLEPLAREMTIMRWAPEYRSILWEAVMLEAKQRMEDAQNDTT